MCYQCSRCSKDTNSPGRNALGLCTFAGLTVVKPTEGLVFGDVRIEELERVLCDNTVRNDFVVPDYVRKW